ncbi:unnamed protein product [Prorocentrum cordatum]|uniref:Uncharacterized protein n=1 Tax=Prorocentrum cordatum TaxID=2364126 RepID=A0ABN9XWZ9_9DINO|nr:unnamed protein product [Polarella glacialis]
MSPPGGARQYLASTASLAFVRARTARSAAPCLQSPEDGVPNRLRECFLLACRDGPEVVRLLCAAVAHSCVANRSPPSPRDPRAPGSPAPAGHSGHSVPIPPLLWEGGTLALEGAMAVQAVLEGGRILLRLEGPGLALKAGALSKGLAAL